MCLYDHLGVASTLGGGAPGLYSVSTIFYCGKLRAWHGDVTDVPVDAVLELSVSLCRPALPC